MRGVRVLLPIPSSAPTGRRLLPVPGESGAVVQGAGLTRRRAPLLGWRAARGLRVVHHRPPRRTDDAAAGAGSVTPPTGTGRAASRRAHASRRAACTQGRQSYGGKIGWPGRNT
jgi:hypothetical protein